MICSIRRQPCLPLKTPLHDDGGDLHTFVSFIIHNIYKYYKNRIIMIMVIWIWIESKIAESKTCCILIVIIERDRFPFVPPIVSYHNCTLNHQVKLFSLYYMKYKIIFSIFFSISFYSIFSFIDCDWLWLSLFLLLLCVFKWIFYSCKYDFIPKKRKEETSFFDLFNLFLCRCIFSSHKIW